LRVSIVFTFKKQSFGFLLLFEILSHSPSFFLDGLYISFSSTVARRLVSSASGYLQRRRDRQRLK
jgi:hypothetical protein